MKGAIAATVILLLAGCATVGSRDAVGERGPAPGCQSAEARLDFDFGGASFSRCTVLGPRSFALTIAPEHAPPINPSPWYAFRYTTTPGADVSIRLDYLHGQHRYAPKLTRSGSIVELPVTVAPDRRSAALTVPAGVGTVSAQPVMSAADHARYAATLRTSHGAVEVELGRSHDGRPITGLRLGDPAARWLIVILGRQHPPEVTGAYALEPFVTELAEILRTSPDLARDFQLFAVPLLNPDGVERGHWRANRGGVDLNRDWGPFSQPETRAVRDFLLRELGRTQPIAMVDFHSTRDNLFYVQGDEGSAANRRFISRFLMGKETRFAGYAFSIEPRNANPGSPTAKNWFHACFGIPSITYEVGDDAGELPAREAARHLAREFIAALRRDAHILPAVPRPPCPQ